MRMYDGNYYLKVPIDNNDYVYIKYIEHADGSMEFESIDEKMHSVIDKQGEAIYWEKMIDYYYEQLNFTERRIYKSIYVSIVNKESYVYIAHIKKENLEKI